MWLAGYSAIVREMNVVKFNFFLDEIIMRRNRSLIYKLEKDGKMPGSWNTVL